MINIKEVPSIVIIPKTRESIFYLSEYKSFLTGGNAVIIQKGNVNGGNAYTANYSDFVNGGDAYTQSNQLRFRLVHSTTHKKVDFLFDIKTPDKFYYTFFLQLNDLTKGQYKYYVLSDDGTEEYERGLAIYGEDNAEFEGYESENNIVVYDGE